MRPAIAACALSLAAAGSWAAEPLEFSTSIEMVRLDVSVTFHGQPVKYVAAKDFEVLDNGVVQEVELVGGADKAVHAVLALDTSSSLAGAPLGYLKAAAHALVDVLRPQDTLTLLTFSDRVELRVSPDEPRERAHKVIDATEAQRSTALYDATFAALSLADSRQGRPLVLVFSDGQDVGSWFRRERVLRLVRESEPVVDAIVRRREGTEVEFLREVATLSGGEIWPAENRELKEILLQALEEFRSRYTLQYALNGPVRKGWHKIEVRVKREVVTTVRAREGYWHEGDQP